MAFAIVCLPVHVQKQANERASERASKQASTISNFILCLPVPTHKDAAEHDEKQAENSTCFMVCHGAGLGPVAVVSDYLHTLAG
eukprot:CAMPEP_0206581786 /NCGR_PEP_ID=MMETSP0325_2-20121206/34055_1 /ASSEMBLY_ACC=CAM_ASM_000347 /TAXON_ID=2866 /ORGANISM="Crypthecodinium cohnii, Strain Seligo" /LENGTH=83 /DNA_ID=CAMNT_0054088261 /DNA_START=12 /DNA_END=260 /DNA_ORIENTATION=+